jgi:hypothetical protein
MAGFRIAFEPFTLDCGRATIGPLVVEDDPAKRSYEIDIVGSESRTLAPGVTMTLRLTIASIEKLDSPQTIDP